MESEGLLERLLRAYEDSARAAGSLVELQRLTGDRLDNIEALTRIQTEALNVQTRALNTMVTAFEEMGTARDAAVVSVKEHTSLAVSAAIRESESWWRRALWIAVGLITLSNLIGVGLEKLMQMFPQ